MGTDGIQGKQPKMWRHTFCATATDDHVMQLVTGEWRHCHTPTRYQTSYITWLGAAAFPRSWKSRTMHVYDIILHTLQLCFVWDWVEDSLAQVWPWLWSDVRTQFPGKLLQQIKREQNCNKVKITLPVKTHTVADRQALSGAWIIEVWRWRHCLTVPSSPDVRLAPDPNLPPVAHSWTTAKRVTSQLLHTGSLLDYLTAQEKVCKMSLAVTHFLRDFLPIISGPGGYTEKQTRWHKREFWVLPPWKIRTFKTVNISENTSRQCP